MAKPKSVELKTALKRIEVRYLRVAAEEARSFLSAVQYAALVDATKCLKDWPSGPLMSGLRISPIDEFHELKEKGGIYGKLNIRVFFAFLKKCRRVYLLGAYKKEAEGQTPRHVVLKMRNRLRELKKELKE